MIKRILAFSIWIAIFSFSPAWGQQQIIEISSSPNPVGSGARALGMGGAFIGVADDATAASWNPAGLIQLEFPEVSIVGAYNFREEDTTYIAFPEASGPQSISTAEMNYLSFAYPFSAFNRNMIVSLNFQHAYDFNKKVNFGYNIDDASPPPLSFTDYIEYDQEGAFRTLSPAVAFQITPFLSFGVTLNFWNYGLFENKWESEYRSKLTGTLGATPLNIQTNIDESYVMDGLKVELSDPFHWNNVNFNLGVMYVVNSKVTLGAVFKSPFEAHLQWDYHFDSSTTLGGGVPISNVTNRSGDVELEMPMSYGVGMAVRLSDALTLDLDVYRTEWSDYVLYDADGNDSNPITGKDQSESDIADTVQVRMGGEYLFIRETMVIPLRAGIFYDPEPAEGSPDDFFGFSIGSGIAYKQFVFDMAYQYRFGKDVRSTYIGNADSYQDVEQHTVYMSLIYHF